MIISQLSDSNCGHREAVFLSFDAGRTDSSWSLAENHHLSSHFGASELVLFVCIQTRPSCAGTNSRVLWHLLHILSWKSDARMSQPHQVWAGISVSQSISQTGLENTVIQMPSLHHTIPTRESVLWEREIPSSLNNGVCHEILINVDEFRKYVLSSSANRGGYILHHFTQYTNWVTSALFAYQLIPEMERYSWSRETSES